MVDTLNSCEHGALCQIDVFKNLATTELQRIEAITRRVELPANTPLLFAGEVGEAVYFILSGTVNIYRPQISGGRFLLNVVGAGEMLGEVCASDNLGHSASAITTEPSTLLRLRRQDFCAFESEMPALVLNVKRLLAARLRFATAHNEALAPYDARRRVSRILLAFSDRYRNGDSKISVTIPVRLTQYDISELSGVTRQHVCKNVTLLRKAHCIETDSAHRLTVIDRAGLLRHCL